MCACFVPAKQSTIGTTAVGKTSYTNFNLGNNQTMKIYMQVIFVHLHYYIQFQQLILQSPILNRDVVYIE